MFLHGRRVAVVQEEKVARRQLQLGEGEDEGEVEEEVRGEGEAHRRLVEVLESLFRVPWGWVLSRDTII